MNEMEELNLISYLKGFQVLKSRENYQGRKEIMEWAISVVIGRSGVYSEVKQK